MPSRTFIPVPHTQVKIDDSFWSPRLKVNREQTIPHNYEQCKETGRIDAFKLEWKEGMEPVPHIFWDSDVGKWLEAASHSLAAHPDPALDSLLDNFVASVAKAQQPDGYLNSHFAVVEPEKRWRNLRDAHELYCAGHLIEAAVAHYQATGKRTLLDVMQRYADYIDFVFGPKPGQVRGYCGHEEIELALVKLYRVTGEKRYLRLSGYFVNERGREPNYFALEAEARGEDPTRFPYEYNQSHKPVREQTEVTGHAVRAMYLYSAMADLAGELNDESLFAACKTLWRHLITKRLYLTGGLGSSWRNEGFTRDYDLPNETAYAETCAGIGLVFWAHRLSQLECDSEYADVMERALYNNVLSSVSLGGRTFFYDNPLAATTHERQAWFSCACCPPNLARLLASFGGCVYAQSETDVVVHLYVGSHAQLSVGGQRVGVVQETAYPWQGAVTIRIESESPIRFGLRLRIPGWCRGAAVKINDTDSKGLAEKGYVRLEREWRNGDAVSLDLPMPVERVYAHPNVRADAGRAGLQRGPLVYCLEACDHVAPVNHLALPADAPLTCRFDPELLGGVMVISAEALRVDEAEWGKDLYRPHPARTTSAALRAIPYCLWGNREVGEMAVWLRSG